MYRVIVVDDEIWSVLGLKKLLKENSDRFELVYETTDSLDALEQICQRKPDVVFTDVRMPEMNGIELMRNVRERGVKTSFVVISGFAEFTYVQQALREGAIDYQLKPFDRATVTAMLDRLYEKMESRKQISDFEFYSLLRDNKDNVPQLLQGKLPHALYSRLQVVVMYSTSGDIRRIQLDLGENTQSLCLKVGPRKCIVIANSDEDLTERIQGSLAMLEGQIERASISRSGSSVDYFEQLLMEAEVTMLDSFVYPKERIFRYRRSKRSVLNHLEEQINDLYVNRKIQQIGKLISVLGKIFHENDMGVEDAVHFWNRIARYSIKQSRDGSDVLEYVDIYELTERFSDLDEMCAFLTLRYVGDKSDQSRTVNDKFFEMLRYIDQNYAEPLYLKELCGKFYINMSYCCELFQKHENMTFSQYLTHVRIKKACELMKYHGATVSEACELVGYKDYFYFNKVFKKKMGRTPAEFRKSELMEN